ncbi:hypothetical protein BH11ARM1_BH11ARM1_17960 [soil metagenome]
MVRVVFFLAFATLFAAGCGKPEATPVPAALIQIPTDLVPMAVGNKWVYSSETDGDPGPDVTYKMSSVANVPGGKEAQVDIYTGDTKTDQQVWRLDSHGLSQISAGLKSIQNKPPVPLVASSDQTGFTYEGVGALPNSHEGKIKVVGRVQKLKSDPKIFPSSTMAVESETKYRAPTGTMKQNTICWYAPGKGLVRCRIELDNFGVTVMQLKTQTLK